MKKIIFAFTLVLFAAVSMAQAPATPKTPDPAKVAARKDVTTDLKTLKQDENALKAAKKSNDPTALAAAKVKVQADRVALKAAVKQAKSVGVKPHKGMAAQMAKRRQAAAARRAKAGK
jgi:hypothetical protein